MNKINILPADTYLVVNKTIMCDLDRKILTMLYQPIIGITPINLYLTFWTDLDRIEIMSSEYTHHHLMTNMKLKLNDIVEAREKLEAIGLIKTYLKKDNINNYVYELYSPLSASEFLTHPLLSILLCNNIGNKEYNKIINYFKLPKINMSDFEDITIHFSDIFDTKPSVPKEALDEEFKKKKSNNLNIDLDIDYNLIVSSLPKGLLNIKTFEQAKDLIKNLSYLYKIDTMHMTNIIRGCINESGMIDKLKLRTACRNYYQFENNNELPGLIYHSQPEHLRKQDLDESKRTKIIYTFENLSPYDFLRGKYNGGNPTSRDIKLVESLMIEQELNPGVVNVLIDYVLKINDNKLNKNFVETIAGQWKRFNIKTVEEAMRQAEKEHKNYKKKANDSPKKTTEKLPDWFDKDIESKKLSNEKEQNVKSILEKYSS